MKTVNGPRLAIRKLLIQLLSLCAVFLVTLLIQVILPFRQAGPIYMLRIVLFVVAFAAGGAWLCFSLLGLPRALLGLATACRARIGLRHCLPPVGHHHRAIAAIDSPSRRRPAADGGGSGALRPHPRPACGLAGRVVAPGFGATGGLRRR